MVAIFSYGFDVANDNFKNADITLHTLSNYESVLTEAAATNYISETEIDTLSQWNANPSVWNAN